MEEILKKIKHLVIRGHVFFTKKARREMRWDSLEDEDVLESIVNAASVRSKRSRSPRRKAARERVYIIVGTTYSGLRIYTKGVFRKHEDEDVFYLLISSKLDVHSEEGE